MLVSPIISNPVLELPVNSSAAQRVQQIPATFETHLNSQFGSGPSSQSESLQLSADGQSSRGIDNRVFNVSFSAEAQALFAELFVSQEVEVLLQDNLTNLNTTPRPTVDLYA